MTVELESGPYGLSELQKEARLARVRAKLEAATPTLPRGAQRSHAGRWLWVAVLGLTASLAWAKHYFGL